MVSENNPCGISCPTRKFMLNPKEFTNTHLDTITSNSNCNYKQWPTGYCTWIVLVPGHNCLTTGLNFDLLL